MLISNGSLVTKTVSFTTDGWFPSMPPMSSTMWPSAYAGIYRRQLWVYVLVSKLARAEARLPLPVYERDDMNRPRRDDHPMAKLLRQPNPGMSQYALWFWTRATRGIHGEAFWYKQRRQGAVVGLYPLHPASMDYRDKEGAWFFDNGKLKIDGIPDSDLVHFMDFNPDSTQRGMSPLEPLRATLEAEWSSRVAVSSMWDRGARPSVLLTHPKNISKGAQERLKAEWNQVASGAANVGATVLLEEGMKAEKWELTAQESAYIDGRKLNREEACAAYDVPPPVVHILDRATFSNITEQMRSMYRDTMAPLLKDDESTIEQDLRRAEWPNDDVYAEFLLDEVLRGDFEARSAAYKSADYMTIAEKRKAENLPYIDGTDRIFINLAEQPMVAPKADDMAQAPPFQSVGLPALIAAGVITEQDARLLLGINGTAPGPPEIPVPVVRTVMGRLSWQKALTEIDAKALVADLNGSTAAVLTAFDDVMAAGGGVEALKARVLAMAKES